MINSIVPGVAIPKSHPRGFYFKPLVFSLALILTLLLTSFVGSPSIASTNSQGVLHTDYLAKNVRNQVEQLKKDLHSIPTTPINAHVRAKLTWEWLNAFALDGGYVPVNATQTIASVLGSPNPQASLLEVLDEVIEEFIFLDNEPQAFGVLTAELGPHQAASFTTIKQTYTVGKKPIQTGGGFLVAKHFMAGFGNWQTDNPKAAHYISITSSTKARFVASSVPLRGMHGGFRNTRPTLVFRVASGTLVEGDTVTITYGDTQQGSPGIMTPTFSSDRMPLPLYLSFNDQNKFFELPIQPIKIIGGKIAGVTGFVPSIIKPGEEFTLAVRAQDQFYNRAQGEIPEWEVMLNGQLWHTLTQQQNIVTQQVNIAEPGTYHITIRSKDGSIQGEANPILVTNQNRPRIYWGDTHGHSGFAEGIGTPKRFMQWAKEDARLDYVTHSEHDIWLDDAEWEVLRSNVSEFTTEGEFVAYLGYEWTVNNVRGGHHNVLFRNPQNRKRVPAQFYPTLSKLYQGLREQAQPRDVVVIPHAHQAGDYRFSDPELEPLIEIMSQHGNFEWFGRMYLQHGHRVGFIAASDNHLSQPGFSAPLGGSLSQRGGLGAIMADSLGTDSIFDAMKNIQAYATTGDRMILDFDVNGTSMGGRGVFSEQRTISGRVIGTAPIDTITLIKNEKVIWSKTYLDDISNKIDKEDTFLLSFQSDSEPLHRGDNPRGWRQWQGTLEVLNADIESIEAYDASFPLQAVEFSKDNSNRITFDTKTRGDTSSFLVKLKNIQRTARLQLDIVENRETGGAPPIYRAPKRVPALSFSMALKDLQQGRLEHTQQVDSYIDRALLRRVITDGKREIEFSFTDEQTPMRQGDYYFVRITQANDAIAWSSPVWIGGFDKR